MVPRLRGTYLDALDTQTVSAARDVALDLIDLEESIARPDTPLSTVAAHADHALSHASASGGLLVVDQTAMHNVRSLWIAGYERDLRSADSEADRQVQEVWQWRASTMATWVEDDRWVEMAQLLEDAQTERMRTNEILERLQAPTEAHASRDRYADARLHYEQALLALADYVSGRAGSDRPLRLADEAFSTYALRRNQALSALDGAELPR
jgi:hypothetical protein